jgi:hypothetical protein
MTDHRFGHERAGLETGDCGHEGSPW